MPEVFTDSMLYQVLKDENLPSLCYAICSPEEMLEQEAIGQRRLDDPTVVELTTPYFMGSLSKIVTAYATLILVEEGHWQLEDRMLPYLPENEAALLPSSFGDIRLRHLLSHSAGLPFGGIDFLQQDFQGLAEYLAQVELLYTPGHRFKYSNTGYLILAYLIAQVSGQTYFEFIHARIFRPLQMYQSGFRSDSHFKSDIHPRMAQGYQGQEPLSLARRGHQLYETLVYVFPPGIAGMYSTVGDYCLFMKELMEPRLVRPALAQAMGVAQAVKDPHPSEQYGLGPRILKIFGRPFMVLSGFAPGFSAYMLLYPPAQRAGIFVTNRTFGHFAIMKLAHQLMYGQIFERSYTEAQSTQRDLSRYQGRFLEARSGQELTITFVEDTLSAHFSGDRIDLALFGHHRFLQSGGPYEDFLLTFVEEQGELRACYCGPQIFVRAGLEFPALLEREARYEAYEGSYHHPLFGQYVTFQRGGQLIICQAGEEAMLEPRGPHQFLLKNSWFLNQELLQFMGSSPIEGFQISGLTFEKTA